MDQARLFQIAARVAAGPCCDESVKMQQETISRLESELSELEEQGDEYHAKQIRDELEYARSPTWRKHKPKLSAGDYYKDISDLQKRLLVVLKKLEQAVASGNSAKYQKVIDEYRNLVDAHKQKYPQDKWGYGPGQV